MSLFVAFCLATLIVGKADENVEPLRRRLTPYITDERYRWTGGKVPYVIESSIDSTMTGRISEALKRFNSKVIVQFIRRTNEKNYVKFVGGSGCSSYIGMIGGAQSITLGSWCQAGNIVHEMVHAIGFHHAHNRKDRDKYVRVTTGNFNYKIPTGYTDCEGYDYGSIMHYSENPNLKAINNKNNIRIGQRESMSAQDIRCINKIYRKVVTTPISPAPQPTFRSPRPRPSPTPWPTYRRQTPRPTRRRYNPTPYPVRPTRGYYRPTPRYYRPTPRYYRPTPRYYRPTPRYYRPTPRYYWPSPRNYWPRNNRNSYYMHSPKPTCFNQPSFHAWIKQNLKPPKNPPGMTESQCIAYCRSKKSVVCGVGEMHEAKAVAVESPNVVKEGEKDSSRESVLIGLLIAALVVIVVQGLVCCLCNKNGGKDEVAYMRMKN